MPNTAKDYSQAGILTIMFVLANAIFLSNTTLLPFIDLPNHLAEAAIYKYYEPGNLLSQYYEPTPWHFPNSFHTVFCSLFPDVEWGNRIFHILCIILLSVSMFLTIKQLGGNPWYGLLAILFTYNYNMTFGFVGFAISIPILILLFYTILVNLQNERRFLNLIVALLLVLLFFMHAQNALLGLIIYGIMVLYRFRTTLRKALPHLLLVPLPLLVMILTWWFSRTEVNEVSTWEYLKEYYTSAYFQHFSLRFRLVAYDNFQLKEGLTGVVIACLFSAALLIPLLTTKPWRRSGQISITPEVIYAGIFFLISLGCYIFAPEKLPGQSPLFQRFCTIVLLSFIILASILINKTHIPWLKYFVGAVVVAYTTLWFEYIVSFNRQNASFNEELFAGMEPDSKLAGLIYDYEYRGRQVYIHFPNYYITWKKGISASKIIDYRFGVIRRVAPESELPFYDESIGEKYAYQPQYAKVDYLLVRGRAMVEDDLNLRGFSLWRQSGPWEIHQNQAAVSP